MTTRRLRSAGPQPEGEEDTNPTGNVNTPRRRPPRRAQANNTSRANNTNNDTQEVQDQHTPEGAYEHNSPVRAQKPVSNGSGSPKARQSANTAVTGVDTNHISSSRDMWRAVDRVPTFSGEGEESITIWLRKWEMHTGRLRCPNEELLQGLAYRLTGRALRWYLDLPSYNPYQEPWTINQVVERLRSKFHNDDTKAISRMALEEYVNKGQGRRTVEQYYDDFVKKIALTEEMPRRMKVDLFIKGLRDQIRYKLLVQQGLGTTGQELEDVYETARRMELIVANKTRKGTEANVVEVDGEPAQESQQNDLVTALTNKLEALEATVRQFDARCVTTCI